MGATAGLPSSETTANTLLFKCRSNVQTRITFFEGFVHKVTHEEHCWINQQWHPNTEQHLLCPKTPTPPPPTSSLAAAPGWKEARDLIGGAFAEGTPGTGLKDEKGL